MPHLGKDWIVGLGDAFDSFIAPADRVIRGEEVALTFDQAVQHFKGRKFFAWLHFYDTHMPYDPPDEFAQEYDAYEDYGAPVPPLDPNSPQGQWIHQKHFRTKWTPTALYQAAVTYTDAQVGKVLRTLRAYDLDKNTVVIVVADHGEKLGRHGVYYDHASLYDATIHSPFLLFYPGFDHKTIHSLTSAVDITPTLLDLAGSKLPANLDGISLMPVLKEPEQEIPSGRTVYSFDTANLSHEKKDITLQMIRKAHDRFGDQQMKLTPLPHDAKTDEVLRSLGYIQ